MKTNKSITLFAAVFSNILWGSTFFASKIVLEYTTPGVAVLSRLAIAFVLLLIVGVLFKFDFQVSSLKRKSIELIFLGIVGYTFLYMSQLIALKSITSIQCAAIMLLAPIFTVGLEMIGRKEIVRSNLVVTMIGALGAGFIILENRKFESSFAFTGTLWCVFAAFCLSVSVLLTKRLTKQIVGVQPLNVYCLTLYSMGFGVLGLLPFVLFGSEQFNVLTLDGRFWVATLYLSSACSVLAFVLWNWSIKYNSQTVSSVSMYIKTPVAFGFGALLLGEAITLNFLIGSSLVIAAVLISQFGSVFLKK